MPFEMIRSDITRIQVDAIVSPSNSKLIPGGGLSETIFQLAGKEELEKEFRDIGSCEVGKAVITKGYLLPAKYIIHTVGPLWYGGEKNEEQLLRNCYRNALDLARDYQCESIAFPLIAAGAHQYPASDVLRIAKSEITDFLKENDMMIYLVLFPENEELLKNRQFIHINNIIEENYLEYIEEVQVFADVKKEKSAKLRIETVMSEISMEESVSDRRIEDVIKNLEESFSEMVLRLIDEKNMSDVEVYKRANLDRKLFSKIRTGNNYNPSKKTAFAIALALKLNLDETKDLLGKAGYAVSQSSKTDIIIAYFIEEGIYDIYEVNDALFAFEEPLLGGAS
jgi:Predicted phosphatase homologous to the C-terminal domain of histone macroH2A1